MKNSKKSAPSIIQNGRVGNKNDALTIFSQYEETERKINTIGGVSLGITIISIIIFANINSVDDDSFLYGLQVLILMAMAIASIVIYFLANCLKLVFSITWNITKKIAFIGWVVVPFPFDLMTGLMCLMCGPFLVLFALLFAPAIPLHFCKKQYAEDYKEAVDILYQIGYLDEDGEIIDKTHQKKVDNKPKPNPKSQIKKKKCPACGETLEIIDDVYYCVFCDKKFRSKQGGSV